MNCLECNKKFQTRKSLGSHIGNKHVLLCCIDCKCALNANSTSKENNSQCKTCRKNTMKKWRIENAEMVSHKNKLQKIEIKKRILKHYGNKCSCCNETHIEFLAIDHKNGGGNLHRKIIGKFGVDFYKWIEKNNYPVYLQLLCYNCNESRGAYGYCPHKHNQKFYTKPIRTYKQGNIQCKICEETFEKTSQISSHYKKHPKIKNHCRCGILLNDDNKVGKIQKCKKCHKNDMSKRRKIDSDDVRKQNTAYSRLRKLKILDKYGNKCVCCNIDIIEFLTVNHKYNNGSEERKHISNLYNYLISQNFPKDDYEIMCWNCNLSNGFFGYCPHTMIKKLKGNEEGLRIRLKTCETVLVNLLVR